MSKYLKKTEAGHRKGRRVFAISMVVYALIFLVATAFALRWLWGCMEAYEQTRPNATREAYMEQLTKEHICDLAAQSFGHIDSNIQSEEECRAYILDFLEGGISCARKTAESTETKQVYALRCNGRVIGTFTMTAGEPDDYGFTPWEVSEETADLSFLQGESASVEAPKGYSVYANGVLLDEEYVAASEQIPYDVFEGYYEVYELPCFEKLTYEVAGILGEVSLEVRAPDGSPFVLDETVDLNSFLDNCGAEEKTELEGFVQEYLRRYVIFSGCANDSSYGNYRNLAELIVPGTKLETRIRDALDGLAYAQSRGDTIADIQIHHYVKIGEGRYLCDVTYWVDTIGHQGTVRTENNVKIIAVETDSGLKAEAMTSY